MNRRTSRLPPPEAYAARRAAALAAAAAQDAAVDQPEASGQAVVDGETEVADQAAYAAVPTSDPDRTEASHGSPGADAASAGVPAAHHGHRRAFEGRRRRPRLLWAGAALLVAVVALVAGTVATGVWRPALRLDLSARTGPGQAVPTATATDRAPGGAGSGPVAGATASPAVRAAVSAVLAARARAVVAGDAAAVVATSSGTGTVFDANRLAALPITAWRYADPQVTTTAEAGRLDVSATLDYRLAGEPASTGAALDLVVAAEGDGWRVVAERSHDGVLPWELGRLRVVRGDRTVVIGVGATPGGAAALRDWATDGDAAVTAIRAAVPDGWSGRLTLVVPASSAQAASLTGRTVESLQGLAAVTVAEPGTRPDAAAGVRVLRVYVDTPLVAGMSEQARRILLRHEVTHVATGAPATSTTPLWLEEGLAQYLGYRGSGVPLRVAVQDLRADRLPARPPTDAAFSGSGAITAYEAAHVLCAVMADQVGEQGLLRVYRRTANGSGFAAAWRRVAGSAEGALLAAWQARMQVEAAAA